MLDIADIVIPIIQCTTHTETVQGTADNIKVLLLCTLW